MFIKKQDYENLLEELTIANVRGDIWKGLYDDMVERLKGEIKESDKWKKEYYKLRNEKKEK